MDTRQSQLLSLELDSLVGVARATYMRTAYNKRDG